MVADRLEESLGVNIVTVAHKPISRWKNAGAHRMWLRTDGGRSRTLVLKTLDYSPNSLPAAGVLPFDISQSERLVYAQADNYTRFVPRTYLILNLEDGEIGSRTLVVMEDLASGWARPRLHHDYALILLKLDDIHDAMSRIADRNPGREQLARYDQTLATPLAELFEESVMAEPTAIGDPQVGGLLSTWPDVRNILVHSVLPEVPSVFVHGDLAPANIFIRWVPTPQLRLIDYEWLGFGFPHADLACLLKRARPSIERLSLRLYTLRHRENSPLEHKIIYEWCQICRGMLDAAYLVAQCRMIDPDRESCMSNFVRLSLQRTWLAAERLATIQ